MTEALGNFKGVMLCNRPAQIPGSLQTMVGPSVGTGSGGAGGPQRPAFVSSVVAEGVLGLPPVRQQRVAARTSDPSAKENDVTRRHKRWLAEFAERRGAIAGSMEARVAEQAERARRFAERNQAMRDAIRGIKSSDADADQKAAAIEAALGTGRATKPRYVPTEYVDVSQQYPQGAPITHYEEQLQQSPQPVAAVPSQPAAPAPAPSTSRKPAAAKSAAKPGWARSQAEDDDFLDLEADALLSFAKDLDYEEYIDDLEVREALRFVEARVQALEADKQTAASREEIQRKMIDAGELEEVWVVDESRPRDEATGEPVMKKVVRRTKKSKQAMTMAEQEGQGSNAGGISEQQSEKDRLAQQEALSRAVLDSNRNMRNIHSSASVRAIMEKEGSAAAAAAAAGSGGQAAPTIPGRAAATLRRSQLASIVDEDAPLQPPVISTHHERDQAGSKAPLPSNLPFLYRHPGI